LDASALDGSSVGVRRSAFEARRWPDNDRQGSFDKLQILMAWFKKARTPIAATKEKSSRVPEGLWVKCPDCSQIIYNKDLTTNLNVCPKCAHHFRVNASERLRMLFDGGTWEEHDKGLVSTDPLGFTDTKPYKQRLEVSVRATGMKEGVLVGSGRLEGIDVVIAAQEYGFIAGSMGVVVGEKLARCIERAIERRCPVVIVCCSGGARMMEGALSLMQMAKVSGALARLDRERLPYIAVLTDPTTGGVTASFAMLGDLNIAEPKALIGFAGPRVIEQTIRQTLPEGFQRSEFLLEKGMLDLIIDRRELKMAIANALRFMGAATAASAPTANPPASVAAEPAPQA
jgi:acetyl-CoA carboxylase carboxyl transferase subunit beta